MKRILVPVNLRSDYDNVVAYASSFAKKAEVEVTLFFVRRSWFGLSRGVMEYASDEPRERLAEVIRHIGRREKVAAILDRFDAAGVKCVYRSVPASSIGGITREANSGQYDLMLMGTHSTPGIRGRVRSAFASRIVSGAGIPTVVVPAKTNNFDFQHITYAVDLRDYDPKVVRQVKEIATLFDAKLTIAHVNTTEESGDAQYASVLEQLITSTIDYPKVYYKFFDHADILRGIKSFTEQHNTNMLAMMNRKQFSWRGIWKDESLTRRMARDLNVPLLALRRTKGE
jgi:nucleotide-binding universal stress UspA family protein